MAYLTQLDTSTLSNQNIATALLVHTYTNTTRIRKIYINVDLSQIAGNGDYIAYLTIRRAGAGDARDSIRTTNTVVSGSTSTTFGSGSLIIGATDVVKVYIIGLAADTTTPDITTTVFEEYIATDANGYITLGAILGTALTEASAGYLAAAFKKLFDVASPVLTAASANQTGDAYAVADGRLPSALVSGRIDASVGAVANGAITAAAIADDAIDAGAIKADAVTKIQAGLSTLTADGVHDEVIEGALTFRQAMRLVLAVLTGKTSGGGTATYTIRDIGDTKDRVVATVDGSGNRTTITTRDGS